MERKTDRVRSLVAAGEYREALRIAKDFHIGISRTESDLMKRGYECIVHPEFYKSIGVDVDRTVRLGVAALKCLYGV
ncbi:MAG: hypothetical protein IKJ99_03570 [Oscillospiraceae bacterium]|nr:hypothetical protein [Oscillospiraceae bacterium]